MLCRQLFKLVLGTLVLAGPFFNAQATPFSQAEDQLSPLNLKGELMSFRRHGLVTAPLEKLWSQQDSEKNHFEGTSTLKAYKKFKVPIDRNEVIVAVIDSGVDINHIDLKGKIWVNPGEMPGDGIDNDQDGYVDDLNGWNFLGSRDEQGKNINVDGSTLECTRELKRLHDQVLAGTHLSPEDLAYQQKLSLTYDTLRQRTEDVILNYQVFAEQFALLKKNGLKRESLEGLREIPGGNLDVENAKKAIEKLYLQGINSDGIDNILTKKKKERDFAFNFNFDVSSVIHDDPSRLDEKGYGNNDVIGPNPEHGTHVAGIIAADRMNHLGMQGQALNVKIMSLRVVPDGDERDKDVANAIRFAVDHHARIINMSFGKPFSPQKAYVDAAVKYAEDHQVLIVHASGNDGEKTDDFAGNFPNKKLADGFASNWIEVGASSQHFAIDLTKGSSLAASFSNWGKNSVDLFAPGTEITSTVANNRYETLQGTSMAAPQVSGIAALLLEMHPELKPQQLKSILMATVTQYPGVEVLRPGSIQKVSGKTLPVRYDGDHILFSELSASGGIVNAFNALSSFNP